MIKDYECRQARAVTRAALEQGGPLTHNDSDSDSDSDLLAVLELGLSLTRIRRRRPAKQLDSEQFPVPSGLRPGARPDIISSHER